MLNQMPKDQVAALAEIFLLLESGQLQQERGNEVQTLTREPEPTSLTFGPNDPADRGISDTQYQK